MTTESSVKRCLGFDFGLKRIGVAVGNPSFGTTQALDPIRAKDGIPDWSILTSLLEQWQPSELVVGLPLNMDGTENDMCLRAKKFGKRMHGRFHLPVHMVDERLSSFAAKEEAKSVHGHLDFGDFSVDGAAACMILETWFQEGNT